MTDAGRNESTGSQPDRSYDVTREYEGDGIVVEWYASRCIHSTNCVRALRHVFDPRKRPWVNAHADTADRIAEAIQRCPSGALHYRRTDGAPNEQADPVITVKPMRDGPLHVRGDVSIESSDGATLRRDLRMALCRCNRSSQSPFCDYACRKTGWVESVG